MGNCPSIFCLAKAGGAPLTPAGGISRWSMELGSHTHSEATGQRELMLHFYREVVHGARGELDVHLTHLQQGSVMQRSTFAKGVLEWTREKSKTHTQQSMC